MMEVEGKEVYLCANISKKQSGLSIGAALFSQAGLQPAVEMFEFIDNDQLSSLDSLLIQTGPATLYLPDELEDSSRGVSKKISNILLSKNIEVVYMKKSTFKKYSDAKEQIAKLNFVDMHILSLCEVDRPLSLTCLACLIQVLQIGSESEQIFMKCSSLDSYMRLDSAATDAVNLLPKPDHPSQFGSIFGVLNRCKTKMGSRLLERWLRQPLVNHSLIKERQDVVELLVSSAVARNQLTDSLLKSLPDLDSVLGKISGKKAGLKEMVSLWNFTNTLPKIVRVCEDLTNSSESNTDVFKQRILDQLLSIAEKFETFQRLIEHVVDLSRLPELVVNHKHDAQLAELAEEQNEIENEAEALSNEASQSWAAGYDVRLERHGQFGFVLRTPKSLDERELQRLRADAIVLAIKKNGVHFSTSALQSLSSRMMELERQYEKKQVVVVEKALEAAVTYIPVAELASAAIAELDLFTSFASVAALSADVYSRPIVLEKGGGVIKLIRARHPCVELMDNMQFIANDYNFVRGESNFQIVTGPNMGGKSTYIRGIGSIVVMAQIGSFVPCEYAEISAVDCILARVGAGDAVQKGVSTFMAEMLEASVILETATSDSLIIIDELGRGTSTFDGFGIARAISEYIIVEKQCICLFATHFHDLTSLSQDHKGVVNRHVTVHVDSKNQMTMLYNVQEGACTQSYGIYVAMAAGFPNQVVESAKRKAEELENETGYWSTEKGIRKHNRIVEIMKTFAALPCDQMNDADLQTSISALPFEVVN